MKVNSISNNYQNINKQYATKPVFKGIQAEGVIPTAIIETLVESANDRRNPNAFMSKINYFKFENTALPTIQILSRDFSIQGALNYFIEFLSV